jgi:hypothetical protein
MQAIFAKGDHMSEANISDYSQQPYIPNLAPIGQSQEPAVSKKHKQDSEESSLEASMLVATLVIPSLDAPILVPSKAGSEETLSGVVTGSMAVNGMQHFILSAALAKENEIKDGILDSWKKNLEEIEDEVRRRLKSPQYIEQDELRRLGDPSQGDTSGIRTATDLVKIAATYDAIPINSAKNSAISSVDSSQGVGNVSPAHKTDESTPVDDGSKMRVLALGAALIAGGAIAAVGDAQITTSATGISNNPAQGAVSHAQNIQPLFPQIAQDLIPMVNLMVMPLIYYTSWDASIGNKGKESQLATAQNFAKEAIKMVSDPTLILTTVVNHLEKMGKYTPDQLKQFTNILKLILASVALSLLYAVEVGKSSGSKFLGMEPQEFHGMLTGTIPLPDPSKGKLSETDQLKLTLINQVRSQLAALPPEERAKALEATFEYLTTTHSIEDMTQPSKVFDHVLASSAFNSEAAGLGHSPV